MNIINAQSVYSFVLTETEWYSGTDQQRQAWVVQCEREALNVSAKYGAILVEPDAVLSMIPETKRHKVWGSTLQVDNAETKFRDALLNFLCDAEKGLSISDVARLARKVIGEYAR